jgi:hypothetical protein
MRWSIECLSVEGEFGKTKRKKEPKKETLFGYPLIQGGSLFSVFEEVSKKPSVAKLQEIIDKVNTN